MPEGWFWSIARVAGLLACVLLGWSSTAIAKTPGTTYCYVGVCHRVLTLDETRAQIGISVELVASYYDAPWRDPFNPSLATSSGETFRPDADDSAASPIYPDGTRLLVWEPAGGGALVLRVNNAGPYFSNRLLDLSRGAAERLGLASRGVGKVEAMVLSAPLPHEAGYAAGRVYAPVPGFIGRFANFETARQAWRAMVADEPEEQTSRGQPQLAGLIAAGEQRVVIIPRRATARRGARGRGGVTLLPVAQRRPLLVQLLAKRRAGIRAVQASSGR